MSKHARLIAMIGECSDPEKLRNWIKNAEREQVDEVAAAAKRRLIQVEAAKNVGDASDPLVLDFWQSITALEHVLSSENGRTTRLSRTRQKISRVGIEKTLADLALKSQPSDGFFLLQDRNMLDMSAEAVILRFPGRFAESVLLAARSRLEAEEGGHEQRSL